MTLLTRPEGFDPKDLHQTRRGIAGMFFAGYALAAAAAQAEPIHTPETGLHTEVVKYPSPAGGELPAFVARPDGKGPHPAIIVVSEIFGVHEYIRDICRRLAKLGYVAVAPAFFFRAGDPAPLTDIGAIMKIVSTADNEQVMHDVEGTVAWLGKQPYVNAAHLGITGYCWGGGVVWMATERFTAFKAGVAWYGRLARPPADSPSAKENRAYPLEQVKMLHAPVLGLYAGQDQGIPVSDVDKMRAALKAAGKPGDLIIYPNAKHGFHADYRDSYNPEAAKDGWKRMLDWFAAHGVAAKA